METESRIDELNGEELKAIPIEDAMAMVEKKKQENVQRFQHELQQLLQKYDIKIEVNPPVVTPQLIIKSN